MKETTTETLRQGCEEDMQTRPTYRWLHCFPSATATAVKVPVFQSSLCDFALFAQRHCRSAPCRKCCEIPSPWPFPVDDRRLRGQTWGIMTQLPVWQLPVWHSVSIGEDKEICSQEELWKCFQVSSEKGKEMWCCDVDQAHFPLWLKWWLKQWLKWWRIHQTGLLVFLRLVHQ